MNANKALSASAYLCVVLFLVTGFMGLVSSSTEAQTAASDIIIEDADSVWTNILITLADLIDVAENVTPRVVAEYANSIFEAGLYSSDDLSQAASAVPPRIIVEHADSLFDTGLYEIGPAAPVLSVSPDSLDFGATQTQKTFNISNAGGDTLTWSVSEDKTWLSVSPTSGTGDATVTVNVDRSGLSPGDYTTDISVSSNGGNETVHVTLEVEAPPENEPPTAYASDINGQPQTMYPDTIYSVTAKYYDPDGRDDLKHCYLQLRHPSKPLTMMWYQFDGSWFPWAGEEGANYLTITTVTSTELANGYELTWSFRINDNWLQAENSIDFGVSARDDDDLESGWDYDNTNASFTPGAEPTCSISGRVTDGSGNPISGVTISDGAGHTATTDSNGNYTLSELTAGTYTITPSKSGYTFSPASRTVSVAPDATGQDFTGSDVSALVTKIQNVTTSTNDRLDQVLTEAHDIAQDGDYFAVAKDEDKVDLIADAMMDSVDVLAEGVNVVKKVQDLTKVQFPGVGGSGWQHIVTLKANSQPARDAFRSALQQPLTAANAKRAAKELFNGAHIYYAADMADAAAENLRDETIKEAWKFGLQSDLALQTRLYPTQQCLVADFKQDVADTGAETIANIPYTTPTLQNVYITDLTQRDKANSVMATTLEYRALPLHLARDARESDQDSWITNFLAKFLLKKLAFLAADGPGVLAVEAGSAAWDLYQNIQQLQEDLRMMTMASEGMGGALDTEKRIYLNTVNGLDNIAQGVEPHIAQGDIAFIANKSEGEYKVFGRWFWCERSSYSDVNVSNSTSYDSVYQAIADYGKTGFLGASYQPLVTEGAKAISGGGLDTIRAYYKQEDEGTSPDEDSTIWMDLLGSTDTGTYHVTHDSTTWNPTRVTASGGIQMTTRAQQEAATIPYPIRTRMSVTEDNLTYTPYIWVDNPFTETVAITLTQSLPADVQIIDANGGSVVGNSLCWQRTINPQVTVEITHVIRYLGDAGQMVPYPEPQLEMTDLEATAYVTFTGETETFISEPPLSAVGIPPAEIAQGETATIPITVTNRLADQAASGTVRLSLIDFEAETEVYSDTQDVTVSAGGSQVVALWLDTTNVSEGDYLLTAVVESNGGQEEAFAEYVKVKLYRLYLPFILKNYPSAIP